MKQLPLDLDALIDEAIMDCDDEYECRAGFLCALEDNLHMPFKAIIDGKIVTVMGLDGNDRVIKAEVKIGKVTCFIDIIDLAVHQSIPGSEWIRAYQKWGD